VTVLRRHPIVSTVVAMPLVFALAFAGLVALWLHGVQIPFASGARWFEVTKTASGDYTPAPDKPIFLLAIGNDERPGVGGARGDALHLIGVNPMLHKATILDIPRDTGAAIPGHGTDKINAANAFGGPKLSAETVGNMVGVQIPYAIQTNFAGFTGMIDDLGGLTVNIPEAMRDKDSGANFNAGPARLTGQQVLAFSRNRHQFPTGDIKRTENQGYVIIQALAQMRAEHSGLAGTVETLAILGRHTKVEGLGLRELYELGRLGISIDPANVRNVAIPVGAGRGSQLSLGAGARELFADFADNAVLDSH
jgi:LCP family protein required for cell wall assembly